MLVLGHWMQESETISRRLTDKIESLILQEGERFATISGKSVSFLWKVSAINDSNRI